MGTCDAAHLGLLNLSYLETCAWTGAYVALCRRVGIKLWTDLD